MYFSSRRGGGRAVRCRTDAGEGAIVCCIGVQAGSSSLARALRGGEFATSSHHQLAPSPAQCTHMPTHALPAGLPRPVPPDTSPAKAAGANDLLRCEVGPELWVIVEYQPPLGVPCALCQVQGRHDRRSAGGRRRIGRQRLTLLRIRGTPAQCHRVWSSGGGLGLCSAARM